MKRTQDERRDDGEAPARIAVVVRLAGDEPRMVSALRSAEWADEKIVVDLGSNARVIRECAAHGAVLVEAEEVPEEARRREVDWVLFIEGHEEIPPALAREIRVAARKLGCEASPVAYRIGRRVRFFGRRLRSRRWTAPRIVRLARRDAVLWRKGVFGADALPTHGRVGRLDNPLLAEPGPTLAQHVGRMNTLSDVAARGELGTGRPVRWRDLILGPTAHGLRTLPEALVRDGVAGIVLAVLEEYQIVLTYAKRWELENPDRRRAGV